MSKEKVNELNNKVGRQEIKACPNCKKSTEHTFCRKDLPYFNSNSYVWYWQCDNCRTTQELFRY